VGTLVWKCTIWQPCSGALLREHWRLAEFQKQIIFFHPINGFGLGRIFADFSLEWRWDKFWKFILGQKMCFSQPRICEDYTHSYQAYYSESLKKISAIRRKFRLPWPADLRNACLLFWNGGDSSQGSSVPKSETMAAPRHRLGIPMLILGPYFHRLHFYFIRFKNIFSAAVHSSWPGCQMVCFRTKNSNLGELWRVLRWKMLVYFMAIWSVWWPSVNILQLLGIFYGNLVFFHRFGKF
jgi:hypothetical protein